jgi:hypothetical protein
LGSTFDDRLVKQQHLLLVRRLKSCCPLFKVIPRHGCGSPLARHIAALSSLDQLFQGHLEVVQLDSRPQRSRHEPFLIPFNSRPVAPLQNHALALSEEILRKNPQLLFETHSKFFIPHINAEAGRPLVLVQSDCRDFGVRADERESSYPRPEAHISTRASMILPPRFLTDQASALEGHPVESSISVDGLCP